MGNFMYHLKRMTTILHLKRMTTILHSMINKNCAFCMEYNFVTEHTINKAFIAKILNY